MGKYLIDTQQLTTVVRIGEDTLRQRLAFEVMEQLGYLDDGKPTPGVSWVVGRGEGHKPGYVISIQRDMTKDTRAKLAGPGIG